MVGRDKPLPFRARIYKVGINRCVDVPERVSSSLGQDTHVPVKGWVEGEPMRSTLVPRGGGRHRLFIHSRIWRKLGVDTGDVVEVSLLRDTESREVPLPDDLAAALPEGSEALAAFNDLTVADRRRFVARILEAKKPETRERRIQQGIELLVEGWRRKRERR
ncbi:MAG: YdeI/OmpD-associated family protein [Anaerolineae bacterium]